MYFLWKYFTPIISENKEITRRSLLIDQTSSVETIIISLWYLSSLIIGYSSNATFIFIIFFIHSLLIKRINNLGKLRVSSNFMVFGMFIIFLLLMLFFGGILADFYIGYTVVILLTGFLYKKKDIVIMTVVCILSGILVFILELEGYVSKIPEEFTIYTKFISTSSFIIIFGALTYIWVKTNEKAIILSQEIIEKKLIKNFQEKAEKSEDNHFKEIILGVVHDFNNLIMIMDNLPILSNNENISDIQLVTSKTKELNKTLISYLKNRGNEVEEINVNNVLRQNELIYNKFVGNNIILLMDLTEKDTTINMLNSKFDQIIINLLANARDALHQKKYESGNNIEIVTKVEKSRLILTVSDNGIGILPETKMLIFEAFFTTKDYGNGIGLTSIKQIIKDHKGLISFKSVYGEGTKFIVKIPIV